MHRSKQHLCSIASSVRASSLRRHREAEYLGSLAVDDKLKSGKRLRRKTGYATASMIAGIWRAEIMSVRIKVPCNCWDRGLCAPWPYDPAILEPPNEDRDFLTVKDAFSMEFHRRFAEWRDTACEHGGWAYNRNLGSNGFVRRLEDDVRKITGSATPIDDMLLPDILECVNNFTMWHHGAAESDIIIAEIDELLATGKVPDVAPPDRDSTKQGLLWIREGAVASVEMQKHLMWG